MSQPAGRILCPRCGANNFDTVAVCWKCSAPLKGPARHGQQPSAPTPDPAAPASDLAVLRPPVQTASAGSQRWANRAALWLGLLMPYFGLPIALAFMMCDDPRRQEVGRICLMWSIISSAIHFVLLIVSLLGLRDLIAPFLAGGRGLPQTPTGF